MLSSWLKIAFYFTLNIVFLIMLFVKTRTALKDKEIRLGGFYGKLYRRITSPKMFFFGVIANSALFFFFCLTLANLIFIITTGQVGQYFP